MKKRILLAILPLVLTGGISANALAYTDERTDTEHSSIGSELTKQKQTLKWIEDNIYYNVLYKTAFDDTTVIDSGDEKKDYIPGTAGYVGDSSSFATTHGITEKSSDTAGWKDNKKQEKVFITREAPYDTGDGEYSDDPELNGEVAGDGIIGLGESDGHLKDNKGGLTAPDTDANDNKRYDDGDSYSTKFAYSRIDESFTLPWFDHNYYHFLGWDQTYPDDGITLPGKMVLEQGSTDDRLYTAYWKDNLMKITLNSGHTDGRHNTAWNEADKNIQPVLAGSHSDKVSLEDDGTIKVTDDIGMSKYTHIAGAQDKIDLEDGDNAAFINLYVPDYHLVPGMEWSTKDSSTVDSDHTANDDEVTYDQSETYHANVFDDEKLTYDDAEVTLFANWEANEYTVTYDAGGTIAANITNKDAVKPFWKSDTENSNMDGDKHYDVSDVVGSYNKWTATQLYTVETTGVLPTPDRNYYTFIGWYVNGDKDKRVETFEDLIGYKENDNRNIRLVAEWQADEYTITYKIQPIGKKTAVDITTTFSDTNREETKTAILGNTVLKKDSIPEISQTKAASSTNDEWMTTTQQVTIEATGVLPYPTRTHYTDNKVGYFNNDNYSPVSTYQTFFDKCDEVHKGNLDDNIYYNAQSLTATPYTVTYTFADIALASSVTITAQDTKYEVNSPTAGTWNTTNDTRAEGTKPTASTLTGTKFNVSLSNGDGASTDGKGSLSGSTLKTGNITAKHTVEDVGSLPTASRTCYKSSGKWTQNGSQVTTFEDIWNDGQNVTIHLTGWTANHNTSGLYKHWAETCTQTGEKVTYCTTCGNVACVTSITKANHNWQDIKHYHTDYCYSANYTVYYHKDLSKPTENQFSSVAKARGNMISLAKNDTKSNALLYSFASSISDSSSNNEDKGNYILKRFYMPEYKDESGIWKAWVTVHDYSSGKAGGESFNVHIREKSCGYTNGQHVCYECSICHTTKP